MYLIKDSKIYQNDYKNQNTETEFKNKLPSQAFDDNFSSDLSKMKLKSSHSSNCLNVPNKDQNHCYHSLKSSFFDIVN